MIVNSTPNSGNANNVRNVNTTGQLRKELMIHGLLLRVNELLTVLIMVRIRMLEWDSDHNVHKLFN